jgi:hypothetical protein
MFKTHTETSITAQGTKWVGTETFTVKFLGITVYRKRIPVVL